MQQVKRNSGTGTSDNSPPEQQQLHRQDERVVRELLDSAGIEPCTGHENSPAPKDASDQIAKC